MYECLYLKSGCMVHYKMKGRNHSGI